MNGFLTTELTGSPAVHLGLCGLAGRCVCCNSLTQYVLSTIIEANIVNTVLKVAIWIHLSMAVTEGPFRVSQYTTEIIFFILNLLCNITIRTNPLTTFDTSWDLSHSPAASKISW